MKCTKCSYEWVYKGTRMYATCPNCYTNNKVDSVFKLYKEKKEKEDTFKKIIFGTKNKENEMDEN